MTKEEFVEKCRDLFGNILLSRIKYIRNDEGIISMCFKNDNLEIYTSSIKNQGDVGYYDMLCFCEEFEAGGKYYKKEKDESTK